MKKSEQNTTISFRKLLLVNDYQKTYPINRKITCTNDARKAFNAAFQMNQLPDEAFCAIFLDCHSNINGMTEISHGVLNSSPITMRELFKSALAHNAHGLIVAHNHPSGNAQPSPWDESVTAAIKFIADIMSIYFHDHLIIAHDQYFSFDENGMIDRQRRLENI